MSLGTASRSSTTRATRDGHQGPLPREGCLFSRWISLVSIDQTVGEASESAESSSDRRDARQFPEAPWRDGSDDRARSDQRSPTKDATGTRNSLMRQPILVLLLATIWLCSCAGVDRRPACRRWHHLRSRRAVLLDGLLQRTPGRLRRFALSFCDRRGCSEGIRRRGLPWCLRGPLNQRTPRGACWTVHRTVQLP